MKLFIDVRGQDVTELYEDWNWLVEPNDLGSPVLMTNFGDLFFQKPDGSIWLLDTITATCSEYANDLPALQSKLNEPAAQKDILLADLVDTLAAQGSVLEPGQLYSFKVLPKLSGSMKPDNVEISDASIVVSVSGQISQQIKDLKPGTEISGMTVAEPIKNRP